MANIFNLPDFMFIGVEKTKLSKFQKLIFLFKGLILSFIHKNTKEKLFCFLMNIFYSTDGKIYFSMGKYFKKNSDGSIVFFPNKRVDRMIVSKEAQLRDLLYQYSLEDFVLNSDDLVVDCGSNIGELYLGLKLNNQGFKYMGFEPDPEAFDCLQLNLKDFGVEVYNTALSNKIGSVKFYLDTQGANSSIDYFGEEESISIESKTLDSLSLERIKLFKLEAEGHELEILQGAIKTLQNIDYIAVDYGPEKGKDGNMTLPEVTNYLFQNRFRIHKSSNLRYTAIFKNLRID